MRALHEQQLLRVELMHHWIGAGLMLGAALFAAFLVFIKDHGADILLAPVIVTTAVAFVGLLIWSF